MDDKTLIEIIRRQYGLQVARLRYLKRAWGAHRYAVDCASGKLINVPSHSIMWCKWIAPSASPGRDSTSHR
jgi:hypothetical protein